MKSIQLLSQTYEGKSIFLTGHTGFKGSWLTYWLYQLGAKVTGYSLNQDEKDSIFHKTEIERKCDHHVGDIRDKKSFKEALLNAKPDYIFHLAAQPLVKLSYEEPFETFDTNIIGTVNLLEAVRHLEKRCTVIVITTDKVYENQEWIYPYRENEPLGGYDPYSASKAAVELIVQSYRSSFFNPSRYDFHLKSISSVRAGNVIGGGDWADYRLIPDIIRAIRSGQSLPVRNPNSVRPWQHVLEPLAGYLWLGIYMNNQPVSYSSAWNFGPSINDTITVKEIVELAISERNQFEYHVPAQLNAPHEAGLLKLDISKAADLLGWYPVLSAKQAVEWTLEWYLSNEKSKEELTLLQLNQFMDLMNRFYKFKI